MQSSIQRDCPLTPHPGTPVGAVRRIDVQVRAERDGRLSLRYTLEGQLEHLRIPPPASPRRADELWQHSCFEAFVAVDDGHGKPGRYLEYNFSPSGEWAAYSFSGYRQRDEFATVVADPATDLKMTEDRLELTATIRIEPSLLSAPAVLQLALCAVVEEKGGSLSYWALRHPPGKPDFHHADGFALEQRLLDAAHET